MHVKKGMPAEASAARVGPRRKRSGISAKEQMQLMLIMLPTFVLIFIFCYIPLYGILIAFQDYVPGTSILAFDGSVKWVGFKHFVDFIGSRTFPRLIRNTLVLSGLNLLFGFTTPIIFALILNEVKARGFKKVVQTASYLPYFISTVIVAGMVLSFIDTNGIINVVRKSLGLSVKAFSMDPKAFPVIYTITNVWKSFGWDSILYLSAMSSIDVNLYLAIDSSIMDIAVYIADREIVLCQKGWFRCNEYRSYLLDRCDIEPNDIFAAAAKKNEADAFLNLELNTQDGIRLSLRAW